MDDLERTLRGVDRIAPPDLWEGISASEPRPPRPPRRSIVARSAVALVVVVLTGAGLIVLNRVFDGVGPSTQPTTSYEPGPITFSEWKDDPEGDMELKTIVRAAADDGSTADLFTVDGVVRDLEWSPDGTRLVYVDGGMFVFDAATGETTTLFPASGPRFVTSATWSPDGTRLAFAEDVEGGPDTISVMDTAASSPPMVLTQGANLGWADWSPDGSRIAFNGPGPPGAGQGWDIYVMNADGSDVVNITQSETVDLDPQWSPDGSTILFRSRRDPPPGWTRGDAPDELYLMAADGTDVRRLTFDEDVDQWPVWSPDGGRIAFTSHPRNEAGGGVYVMRPDGSDRAFIGPGGGPLSWQPVASEPSGTTTPDAAPSGDPPSPMDEPYVPVGQAWSPPTDVDGGVATMPITFPDGTTAEVVYPQELALERLNVYPDTYAAAGRDATCGQAVSATRHDPSVGWIRGDEPIASFPRSDGVIAELWQGQRSSEPHDFLVIRFGSWSVMVGCRWTGEADRDAVDVWAQNLHAEGAPDGLLVVTGTGPLEANLYDDARSAPTVRLSDEHLVIDLRATTADCPSGAEDRVPQDGTVQWCIDPENGIYLYANGFTDAGIRFLEAVVEDLRVRGTEP